MEGVEVLGVFVNVLAVVELSAKLVGTCARYAIDVKNANNDKARLIREITTLNYVSQDVKDLLDGPLGIKLRTSTKLHHAIVDGKFQLQSLARKLSTGVAHATKEPGIPAWKWPFQSKDVEKTIGELIRCNQAISLALQVDQTAIMLSIDQRTILDRLPVAGDACFDSHADEHQPICLDGTRQEVLEHINQWATDPARERIYWLQGKAGTGKSTIARTVARELAAHNRLAASFFFKRGGGDRGIARRLFTTIAAQLAQQLPTIAGHVRAAIEATPDIAGKALGVQFEKLILQPLEAVQCDPPMVMTVVIDALDECDGDQDIKVIIYQLSRENRLTQAPVRFFVTSRFEPPIKLGFQDIHGKYVELPLHEIPKAEIERDIAAYIKSRVEQIRCQFGLPSGWPLQDQVQSLITMAVPLFIVAATACRFIEDERRRGGPKERLEIFLQCRTGSSSFNATYRPILDQMLGLDELGEEELIEDFKQVVGSIITLAAPLSATALERLLQRSAEDLTRLLGFLHSVLDIPSKRSSPIRLFHQSFRDYLIDPKGGVNEFFVDERDTHEMLASRCLQLLRKRGNLKGDITGLRQPGKLRRQIEQRTIDRCLPSEVQYACQYWVYHMRLSKARLFDGHEAFQFLQEHFLHWLEALSLIGRISDSIRLISELQSLADLDNGDQVSQFLYDAKRFILNYRSAIDQTPLQLYSSLLAFAPETSKVRTAFKIAPWIAFGPKVDSDWTQSLQTLEDHSSAVNSVAFSHDSALIVSASGDQTIRIWRADLGECIQTLQGHSGTVSSVAFSHDSALIVSASGDQTIRIWRADLGECIQTLQGHSGAVSSVAFSHDSALIVSASSDETVRVWNANTGKCLTALNVYNNATSAAFSHDSALIVSASSDQTVRVWNTDTGKCVTTLKGHSNDVTSVTFSHDSALIASASYDMTVRVWSAKTWNCVHELKGHCAFIRSVTFSHDSSLIASASADQSVRVWCADTGKCIQSLEGHSGDVTSVAFSDNSTLIASASHDKMVRVWRANVGKYTQGIESHHDDAVAIRSIAFSHNSALIASASEDRTVRVWSAESGKCIRTLEGHGDFVRSVAFSHDSALIASGSEDRTVRIWRTDTGNCVHELEGHSKDVTSVAFSHDSALIASASQDQTIRIWRADTGQCILGTRIGVASNRLQFGPGDEYLLTDVGAIAIRIMTANRPSLDSQPHVTPTSRSNLGISQDRCWVTWNDENLFWLPAECRPLHSAVSGSTIGLGCGSGRVIIIGFSSHALPEA